MNFGFQEFEFVRNNHFQKSFLNQHHNSSLSAGEYLDFQIPRKSLANFFGYLSDLPVRQQRLSTGDIYEH